MSLALRIGGAVIARPALAAAQAAASVAATPTVAPAGATAPRPISDILGEVLNARTCGAKGDGVTDDTAKLQAMLDALPRADGEGGAREVVLPGGDYRISATLTASLLKVSTIRGTPGHTRILWYGPDADAVLQLSAAYRVKIQDVEFRCGAGHRSAAAIQFRSYLGQNQVERVRIDGGYGVAAFDRGIWLDDSTGDANNDHFEFRHNLIENVSIAAWDIEGTQSKAHKFYGNIQTRAQYGVRSEGSFWWFGGFVGSNSVSDFAQTTVVNSDTIQISGVNSEHSARFYCNGAPVFPAEGNVSTSGTSTENHMPIIISSVRFAVDDAALDGIEETDGENARVKTTPTAEELDGAHGTVGWSAVIVNRFGGPLILQGNKFAGGANPAARRLKVVSIGNALGNHVVAIGNVFHADTEKVSPIYGAHGGLTYGPYNGTQRITSLANLAYISGAYTGGSAANRWFVSQKAEGGEAFWAATEWDGFYGATYAVRTNKAHHRILLNGSITTLTLPDGEPGQVQALEFVQHGTNHYAVGGWGANIVLTGGPFDMPYAVGSVAVLTLR